MYNQKLNGMTAVITGGNGVIGGVPAATALSAESLRERSREKVRISQLFAGTQAARKAL